MMPIQKLGYFAAVAAGAALGIAIMDHAPAAAAIVTYDFTVTSGIGMSFGSYSYDDSTAPDSFGAYQLTDFSFSHNGLGLGLGDISNNPLTSYSGGAGLLRTFGSNFSFSGSSFSYLGALGNDSGTIVYTLRTGEPIPEPSAIGGSLLGLGFLWMIQKRLSESQRQASESKETQSAIEQIEA